MSRLRYRWLVCANPACAERFTALHPRRRYCTAACRSAHFRATHPAYRDRHNAQCRERRRRLARERSAA